MSRKKLDFEKYGFTRTPDKDYYNDYEEYVITYDYKGLEISYIEDEDEISLIVKNALKGLSAVGIYFKEISKACNSITNITERYVEVEQLSNKQLENWTHDLDLVINIRDKYLKYIEDLKKDCAIEVYKLKGKYYVYTCISWGGGIQENLNEVKLNDPKLKAMSLKYGIPVKVITLRSKDEEILKFTE